MGLRFRKNISLLPGVRLNISKHGISSVSVGGKGLTYNIGKKGTRATGGLPGTGLSYSHYTPYNKTKDETLVDPSTGEITEQKAASGTPWALILLIALVAVLISSRSAALFGA
jgi:hypothetical protein